MSVLQFFLASFGIVLMVGLVGLMLIQLYITLATRRDNDK